MATNNNRLVSVSYRPEPVQVPAAEGTELCLMTPDELTRLRLVNSLFFLDLAIFDHGALSDFHCGFVAFGDTEKEADDILSKFQMLDFVTWAIADFRSRLHLAWS